jgi:excinuclease ABC subunit A
MEKPDVDHIEGLSPAISIEQKATSHNPRSTVGTITEIYDFNNNRNNTQKTISISVK